MTLRRQRDEGRRYWNGEEASSNNNKAGVTSVGIAGSQSGPGGLVDRGTVATCISLPVKGGGVRQCTAQRWTVIGSQTRSITVTTENT